MQNGDVVYAIASSENLMMDKNGGITEEEDSLLPFILLFCDFGRGWRKLQLNFSVKGGKFGHVGDTSPLLYANL